MAVPALIALGVMAAAAIASSQYSAAEEERAGKRRAKTKKEQEEQDALLAYWQQQAADSGEFANMNRVGTEMRNKIARDKGYNLAMKEVEQMANVTRNQGYIQAGATVAGGIAGGAFEGLGGAAESGLTADQIGDAAGKYALNEGASQLLAKPGEYSPNAGPQFDYTQPLEQNSLLLNDPEGYRFRGRLT